MNAGEWEAGEIKRLLTAATNGDGVNAGAASVVKISANLNSVKMTVKAIEREVVLGAADYIVQDIHLELVGGPS